jgi:hypothetical protein
VPPRLVVATLCRARYEACPAYRFVKAAGRPLHPADFLSWVVHKIPAGCDDSVPQQG